MYTYLNSFNEQEVAAEPDYRVKNEKENNIYTEKISSTDSSNDTQSKAFSKGLHEARPWHHRGT